MGFVKSLYPMKRNIFFLLVMTLACAIEAQADPLTFRNVTVIQNNGTSLDLFSNPNVTIVGFQLDFTVEIIGVIPPGGTDTLRVTYTDAFGGSVIQHFDIPVFGFLQPPVTLVISIPFPTVNFQGVPATLTLDLLGSAPDFVIPTTGFAVNSFTYTFNVAEPVPEPATLTLLGGGLMVLVARCRRGRSGKKG